jgi:Aspartyl protease
VSHFTNLIGPNGPLLKVLIGISGPRHNALVAAGQAVPSPQLADLLIDTGASQTCIDLKFIGQLGLQPTGSVSVHTPSTGSVAQSMSAYDVGIVVHGIAGATHVLPVHSIIACDFSQQGIDGLLGRDILASSRLTYSGPDNVFYLSF